MQYGEIAFILQSQWTYRFHSHSNYLTKFLKGGCLVVTGVSDELHRKEKHVQLSLNVLKMPLKDHLNSVG